MLKEITKRKKNVRLEYKEYHTRGRKVQKEAEKLEKITQSFKDLSVMAVGQLVDDEKKVVKKITRFLDENEDLGLLFDIEDVEKAIIEVKNYIDSYEEIHIELERELDKDYDEQYGECKAFQLATAWVKQAKLEIRTRKATK